MSAFLEGPAIEIPAGDSLVSLLLDAQKKLPFASLTEISETGVSRSAVVCAQWRKTLGLIDELQRRDVDPEWPWVLCFDRAQDFMVAAWAGILLGRDLVPWQMFRETLSPQDVLQRAQRIRNAFGNVLLVTTDTLLSESAFTPLTESTAPVSITHLPVPQERRAVDNLSSREGRFFLETSGTSGVPKLGVLTFKALAERTVALARPKPDSARLSPLSFDSISGLGVILPSRNRYFLMDPHWFTRNPWAYLEMASAYGVQNLVLSTTFAGHLLQAKKRPATLPTLSALESVSFGLEQVVADIVWKVMDLLETLAGHPLKMGIGYGMTETGLLTGTDSRSPGELLPPRGSATPVPVGKAQPGRRIRVVDEAGRVVPEGVQGHIQVQLPGGWLSGYLQEDGTLAALDMRDGWFVTGDLGSVRDDQLTVLGRNKAVIVHGGKNISLMSIDLVLQQLKHLEGGNVAALNLPDPETHTDQLVVAYAQEGLAGGAVEALESEIRQTASQTVKVPVKAVCRLNRHEFPYTTSGKLKRVELAQQVGALLNLSAPEGKEDASPSDTEEERIGLPEWEEKLIDLWRTCLPSGDAVSAGTHFFEAGGDSLQASVMLDNVEMLFHRRIPPSHFYQQPTLEGLGRMLQKAQCVEPDLGLMERTRVLRLQQEFVKAWAGEEPFPGSLMRCFHRQGTQIPCVWIFQQSWEAEALARALGSGVPLMAFHSWHQILEIPDLGSPLAESLTDRMLWEVLGLLPKGPWVLGGNCQGGIPAVQLARRLRELGRAPSQLILTEWSFASPVYPGAVQLMYGAESPVASVYEAEGHAGAGWPELFPRAEVHRLPLDHGQYFHKESVDLFADRLRPFLTRRLRDRFRGICS